MSQWISVCDSLPEYGRRVLIQDVLIRIGVRASTDKQGEHWRFEGTKEDHNRCANFEFGDTATVNKWMPLP